MKRLSTVLGALVLALFGVGTAAAEEGGGAGQVAGQSAGSGQVAGSSSGASQFGPTNSASSIRVLSPGNGGAVTQSNTSTAGAVAANGNTTHQSTNQSQSGGGYGSDATQVAGQSAQNAQSANAGATAVQVAPSNDALSIRVLSPGNDGEVNQSNATTAGAVAANGNETKQSIDQAQVGSGHGSEATQIAGQDASSRQSAEADATAVQWKPENDVTSIRVLSPGSGGDVTQSNDATAVAAALNGNETKQSIDQTQGGSRGAGSGDATQVAGQQASSRQSADADAKAVQVKPSNSASSIRVLSPGNDGDVSQSNTAQAIGLAANGNETKQSIDQTQAGSGGNSTQVAGQKATNDQHADADATAVQLKPSNSASSIRVLSPGNDGDVSQSNTAQAIGLAANGNETKQSIDQTQGSGSPMSAKPVQDCGCGHDSKGKGSEYVQVAGQESSNRQSADADAVAFQVKPSNTNKAIRVLSVGNDGNVSQSNSTTALAAALNANETKQSIDQTQTGRGHGGSYLQVAGQGAWSAQRADADAKAVQLGASNENAPIRVGSKGDSGSVEQSNDVGALALALNHNSTRQYLDQTQSGHGSDSLQVAGQGAWTEQRGGAMSHAIQGGMRKKSKR